MRRIGHAGTLDPSAVGVLPVALGRTTRTLASPSWDVKLYWADVRFGAATDTDDADGTVIAAGDPDAVDLRAIREAVPHFIGPISQRPPAYSAVHVGGTRSYLRARRGRAAELPERRVCVDDIAIVGWVRPVLTLLIQCRSGTYVRSIARDLGAAVRCPAHLDALVRLRVGSFRIEDAVDLDALAQAGERDNWDSVLWPADVAAAHLPAIIEPASRSADLVHGRSWVDESGDLPDSIDARVYDENGTLLGFARRSRDGLWHPLRGIGSIQVSSVESGDED
jgi:tRNA pseudouridine55 synthase